MSNRRFNFIFVLLLAALGAILTRLFHWQAVQGEELEAAGKRQHETTSEVPAKRGEIMTSDGFPLVTNMRTYLLYAYTPNLEQAPSEIANALAPLLPPVLGEATASSQIKRDKFHSEEEAITTALVREGVLWVPLAKNIEEERKNEIDKLEIRGVGFEPSYRRDYPEATMAASLLGFVGSDTAGNPKGYFGLEGFYDLELAGKPGIFRREKDASGNPILIGGFYDQEPREGRNLVLHIDRAIQRLVEEKLSAALRKYGAKSGEVVILEPKTGAVLAMAALPSYDPQNYRLYPNDLYKNPVVSETYEPGSTFKVLLMAAALDSQVVKAETRCDICSASLRIGEYTIRTWNNEYRPDSTMTDVIVHSDNVGMVFVARKLGLDALFEYLRKFGIGEKTGIDLEEESSGILRPKDDWKEIDIATAAFGQGIALTAIQMVRAVATIANEGVMPTPQVAQRVEGKEIMVNQPKKGKRVVSKFAALKVTEMMVKAVEQGEAKWAKPKGIKIAGKTGTAQIPVAGHYDEEKTIASFVGFAPAENPRFVMLVKLREPQSSPWGSETAAPLWFALAKDLLFYFGIPAGE